MDGLALVLNALDRDDGARVELVEPLLRRRSIAVLALQRAALDVLGRALDEAAGAIVAAVAVRRALGVELLEALRVRRLAARPPDLLTLYG